MDQSQFKDRRHYKPLFDEVCRQHFALADRINQYSLPRDAQYYDSLFEYCNVHTFMEFFQLLIDPAEKEYSAAIELLARTKLMILGIDIGDREVGKIMADELIAIGQRDIRVW